MSRYTTPDEAFFDPRAEVDPSMTTQIPGGPIEIIDETGDDDHDQEHDQDHGHDHDHDHDVNNDNDSENRNANHGAEVAQPSCANGGFKVLLDAFHAINRIAKLLKKAHGGFHPFMARFRDACFLVLKDDLDMVEKVLQSQGLNAAEIQKKKDILFAPLSTRNSST